MRGIPGFAFWVIFWSFLALLIAFLVFCRCFFEGFCQVSFFLGF